MALGVFRCSVVGGEKGEWREQDAGVWFLKFSRQRCRTKGTVKVMKDEGGIEIEEHQGQICLRGGVTASCGVQDEGRKRERAGSW